MFPTIRPNHGCGCTREGRAGGLGKSDSLMYKELEKCVGVVNQAVAQPATYSGTLSYLLGDVKLHIHQAGGHIKIDDARHRNKYLFNQEN